MSAEFEIVLHVVSAITFAIVIFMLIIGIIRWKRKRYFPKYTINATVVSKRAKVRRHHRKADTGTQIVTDTFCYVTFKASDTNILELKVSVDEYMALNKGESGKLSFRGATFLGFEKPNGELVWEAANAVKDEATENKKHFFRRKSKVQAENETSKIKEDSEQETENKKLSKKRNRKVKAELEETGEISNVPELEPGKTSKEIESEAETNETDSENNIEASIEAESESK